MPKSFISFSTAFLAISSEYVGRAKAKKTPKPRANKYEEKLSVNGSFADVFKVVKRTKSRSRTHLRSSLSTTFLLLS
jgi:hypothetical protein